MTRNPCMGPMQVASCRGPSQHHQHERHEGSCCTLSSEKSRTWLWSVRCLHLSPLHQCSHTCYLLLLREGLSQVQAAVAVQPQESLSQRRQPRSTGKFSHTSMFKTLQVDGGRQHYHSQQAEACVHNQESDV